MKFFLFAVLIAVAAAADNGAYRPEHQGGSYTHQSGQYVHQDNKYVHQGSDSGRYVHQDNKYVHQGGDSGRYVHQDNKYVHQGSNAGKYVHVVPQVAVPQFVAPQIPQTRYNNEGGWVILKDERDIAPTGDYVYEYETENKIRAREQSQAVAPQSQRGQGFYEYVGPEGQTIHVDYTADENGFQPQGAHLPVAPEVPLAIQRSVEYQLRLARV